VLRAFVVLFDAFDDGDLIAQGDIENVAAFFGAQTHAIADVDRDAIDFDMAHDGGFIFEEIPFPFVHWISFF
jgi:hypothetical protein